MKNIFAILLFLLIASISQANEWKDVDWQTGQILGISSRAGLTPVLVQMGTRSKIDHVGFVIVENGMPWLYEYTNATGIQRVPISEVWARSADRLGEVHFVLGRFHNNLDSNEIKKVLERLDAWVARTKELPPSNCIETIVAAFDRIRDLQIDQTQKSLFVRNALDGRVLKIVEMGYPNVEKFPIIASLFNNLDIVTGNLPENLISPDETTFLKDWVRNGDLSKFARLLNVTGKVRSSTNDLAQLTSAFINRLEQDQVSSQKIQLCLDLFAK